MEEKIIKLVEYLNKKNSTAVKFTLDSFVNTYYNEICSKDKLTEKEIQELKVILQSLDYLYITGEISPLSDFEYDTIHNIYNSFSDDVITNKYEAGNKLVPHIFPNLKGTIEKVHYIYESDKKSNIIKTHKSLEYWLRNSFRRLYEANIENWEPVIGAFLKYDGVSVIFGFEDNVMTSAITRGDKDTGLGTSVIQNFQDITNLDELIPINIRNQYKLIGMKSEIIMPKLQYEDYCEKFKTESRKLNDPRSAVSGLVNSDYLPPGMGYYLRIIPLEYSYDDNVSFPEDDEGKDWFRIDIDLNDDVIRYCLNMLKIRIRQLHDRMNDIDVCCDGVVIRFLDKESQSVLGRDEKNCVNKYEVAFKFPPETAETKLNDIEFQVGLLGNITPVAKIEPVSLNNRKIKSVSLGSIDRLKSLNLHIGDIVTIRYEIIPYLTKTKETLNNNPEIEIPKECPICSHTLSEEFGPLMCINPNCPCRAMGRIENYCEKMSIRGIGPSIIESLFNAGLLKSIQDLYRLQNRTKEMLALPGFGVQKVKSIIDSIYSVREATIETLIGSIGIPSIGKSKLKAVSNIYYIPDIMYESYESAVDKLTKVSGIGSTTANRIVSGLHSNRELIEFLLERISIKMREGDKNIVFSGIRNREFANYLTSLGFIINDYVNKNTKAVIVKDTNMVTEKIKKAESLNIPVVDIITAYGMFNYKQGGF